MTDVRCPKCEQPMRVALVRGMTGLECEACGYQLPKEVEE